MSLFRVKQSCILSKLREKKAMKSKIENQLYILLSKAVHVILLCPCVNRINHLLEPISCKLLVVI